MSTNTVELLPIDDSDPDLDERIMALRATGMSLPRIARHLGIPLYRLHKQIDALLPTIDGAYKRRAVGESLTTLDAIVATHSKTISDPESCSILIRAICEKRALLGIGGTGNDPVQMIANTDRERSTAAWERSLQHLIDQRSQSPEDDPERSG